MTPARVSFSVPTLYPHMSRLFCSYCSGEELMGGLCGLFVAFLVLFLRVTVTVAPLLFFPLPGLVEL